MKVIVSACLLGQKCKYNGSDNRNDVLVKWLSDNGHEAVPVCPEVCGGLCTPRSPCEISDGHVMNAEGKDVDSEFRRGAEIALRVALREHVTLAVLQPRSPSCGKGTVYDGSFSGRKIPGNGVYAQLLIDNGINVVTPDEL